MIDVVLRRFLWWFFSTFHLLDIDGQEQVPAHGPVIIVCNHVNYFDPFLIQLGVKRQVRFIAWVRGFRHVFGWFMRAMGTIPIDLSKPDRTAYEQALTVLRQGGVIGIFPEGGFTPDGHVADHKTGAARLAIETGAVICPATIAGAFRVWAPQAPTDRTWWGRVFPRPGKITLKFYSPVVLDEQERQIRAHDKEYHRRIIDTVMEPIVGRIEPALRAEERIDELMHGPASPIRIYEWLPLIAIVVGDVVMRLRQVWDERTISSACLAYAVYLAYLLCDIYLIPQNWQTKLFRNVIAPIALLIAMFPTLFDAVTAMRLAVWKPTNSLTAHWPFSGLRGRLLADWWTATYLFPLWYLADALWVYYFSHYLQFQKLVRGLLVCFYGGLLLIIVVPALGRGHDLIIPRYQWGALTHWFYTISWPGTWRFLHFPGFFVLMTSFLWIFDRRYRLSTRVWWYAPWVLNQLLAAIYVRGLSTDELLAFIGFAVLVHAYLGRVKFLAHDRRWV